MQAICFDFDGTLVDSEVFHADNWSTFLESWNIDFSKSSFLTDYAGVTWDKVAIDLKSRFTIEPSVEHMLEQMELITEQALLVGNIPAKSGVDALLRTLVGKVPLAVVTGAPRIYVEEILTRHGWLELFDHVFSGDDVANNKPAPDIYQLACETLGFAPHEVLAIEDSLTGVTSSVAAGLKTVLVNEVELEHNQPLDYSFYSMEHAHSAVMALVMPSAESSVSKGMV